MIIDAILIIFEGAVSVLLAPLSVLNFAIDFLSSFSVFNQFLQVVAYLLPFDNLIPLFILTFAILTFKFTVSLIKTIWQLLPIL